ncbi:hypothetical protein [Xanthomonas phage JGB6]|nr:hypothetical protein [Xanthomonas phage JGB6]
MTGFNRQVAVMRNNLGDTNMSLADFEKRVASIRTELQKVDMINFNQFTRDTAFEDWTATLPEKEQRLAQLNQRIREYEILRVNMKNGDPTNDFQVDQNADALIAARMLGSCMRIEPLANLD